MAASHEKKEGAIFRYDPEKFLPEARPIEGGWEGRACRLVSDEIVERKGGGGKKKNTQRRHRHTHTGFNCNTGLAWHQKRGKEKKEERAHSYFIPSIRERRGEEKGDIFLIFW